MLRDAHTPALPSSAAGREGGRRYQPTSPPGLLAARPWAFSTGHVFACSRNSCESSAFKRRTSADSIFCSQLRQRFEQRFPCLFWAPGHNAGSMSGHLPPGRERSSVAFNQWSMRCRGQQRRKLKISSGGGGRLGLFHLAKKLPLQLWAGFRPFLRELGDALPQKVAKSRRSRVYCFMFFEDVGSV